MNDTPKTVSGRVVKKRTSLPGWPSTGKASSAPSERPIQLRCISLIGSGQSMPSRSSSRRSAYAVILKNHCSRSFLVTGLSVCRQQQPLTTCSLARMVRHLLAPPLRTHRAVGEPALVEHQEEEPLRPAVVFGRRRIDFARPIVGASDQLQLSLEVGGVARNGLLGMQSLEQRVVFGRQTEGVPAHRVQARCSRPSACSAR